MIIEPDAEHARIADKTGQVVKVDGALDIRLVGDVLDVGIQVDLVAGEGVAELDVALIVAVGVELPGGVEEEVGVTLPPPACVEEQRVPIRQRIGVFRAGRDQKVRRLGERIAVQNGVAPGIQRIGHRALGANPRGQVGIVYRRMRPAGAQVEQQIVGRQPLGIQLQARGLAAPRVQEHDGIAHGRAAHRRELRIVDVIGEAVEIQPQPVVQQFGLDTGLIGGDGFGPGDGVVAGRRVEGDVATLDRGRAEACRHAAIDIHVIGDGIGETDIPADIAARRLDGHGNGVQRTIGGHVFHVAGPADAGGDGESVGDLVAGLAEQRIGGVALAHMGRRNEERIGGVLIVGREIERADLPEPGACGAIIAGQVQFLGELVQIVEAILGVGREEYDARTAQVAAVDVAAAVAVGGLVAGDRREHHARQPI